MKQIFSLILFLIMASTSVFAQDTVRVQPGELDNLRLLINEHPKADTVRVQLLIDYAQLCFYDLDFLNGLKAANQARSVSKQIQFTKGEGLYLKSMAVFYQRSTFLSDGYSGNLDVYYELEGNRILNQSTNFNIFGGIPISTGTKDLEVENKISNLRLALSYFTEQENKETIAILQSALAIVYYGGWWKLERYDTEKWDEYRELALRLFRELGLSYHELTLITLKIRELWRLGKEDNAKEEEIKAINIYTNETNKKIKALCANLLGETYANSDRSILALEYLFKAEELLNDIGEKDRLKSVYMAIASTYIWVIGDSEKALEYSYKELDLRKQLDYYDGIQFTYLLIYTSLLSLNRIDEFPAEYRDYLRVGGAGSMIWFDAEFLWNKGRTLVAQGKIDEAQRAFRGSMLTYQKINDLKGGSFAAFLLAQSLNSNGDLQNAVKYALIAFEWASQINYLLIQAQSSDLLSQCYEKSGQPTKAFEYLKQYRVYNDKNEKLNNASRISELEVQSVLKKRQREIALLETESQLKEQQNKTQQIWIFSIAGALLSALILTIILVRNNRQKQKTNLVLESTLTNLKSTQTQLIHSEKMASLGELTAGIAHEIQNPLNFVNNFSEVNSELVDELEEEIKKGDLKEAEAITKDIKENEQKIAHHGKRAEQIVKSMLQHSRTSSGEKELTDINALADEYLRLAYHGFRAKDKSFNADFKTDLDKGLQKISVVLQDIGRVLLNLINNAFQAVKDVDNPMVTVSTIKTDGKVEIRVKDNGPGILDDIKEKIFQPFFTTKPTGEGTGLGLSLSYDIVTKGHGGELKVKTKVGVGTEFIIHLPIGG